MVEIKDPVQDRDEFVRRVRRCCLRKDSINDFVSALLDDDVPQQNYLKNSRLMQKAKVYHWVTAYDAAKTTEERAAVVGTFNPAYIPSAEEIAAVQTIT